MSQQFCYASPSCVLLYTVFPPDVLPFLCMEMLVTITFSNSKHFGLVKNTAGGREGKLQTVMPTVCKTSFHSRGMDFLSIVASNTTYVCAGSFYSFYLTVFSIILHSMVTYHLLVWLLLHMFLLLSRMKETTQMMMKPRKRQSSCQKPFTSIVTGFEVSRFMGFLIQIKSTSVVCAVYIGGMKLIRIVQRCNQCNCACSHRVTL